MLANHQTSASHNTATTATTATATASGSVNLGRISVVITHHSKSILYSFDKLKTLPDSIQDICVNHFKLKNHKTFCLRTDCKIACPKDDDLLLTEDVSVGVRW